MPCRACEDAARICETAKEARPAEVYLKCDFREETPDGFWPFNDHEKRIAKGLANAIRSSCRHSPGPRGISREGTMSAINEWNKDGPDYPSDEERCDEGFCHIAEARGEQYRCQGNCAYKGTAPTPPGATPRTDALKAAVAERTKLLSDFERYFVMVGELSEHARQLERELASTSARVGELMAENGKVVLEMARQYDALQEQAEQTAERLRGELEQARACIRDVGKTEYHIQWLEKHAPAIEAARGG